MSASAFSTFLSSVGAKLKTVFGMVFNKALPIATTVATAAEPFVDIAFPAIGPEFTLVTNTVVAVEAKYAAIEQQTGTGAQKMAEVLQAITPTLLPTLTSQGLTSEQAQAKIQVYVQAVVTMLNTFPAAIAAATAAPAAASASA